MEEIWKLLGGWLMACLTLASLVTAWVLHKKNKNSITHKDIYEKMNKKADKYYVDSEIKKINENINDRIGVYMRETESTYQSMIYLFNEQGKRVDSVEKKIDSMDVEIDKILEKI
jgi:cobalamin biosynthesis protein CbiD